MTATVTVVRDDPVDPAAGFLPAVPGAPRPPHHPTKEQP